MRDVYSTVGSHHYSKFTISFRGSQIRMPLLVLTSRWPLEVQISQGLEETSNRHGLRSPTTDVTPVALAQAALPSAEMRELMLDTRRVVWHVLGGPRKRSGRCSFVFSKALFLYYYSFCYFGHFKTRTRQPLGGFGLFWAL